MQIVNERWYDRADAILLATGASSKRAIEGPDGQIAAWVRNGGIGQPKHVVLPEGTRLVRYGSVGLPAAALLGGWWLESPQYAKALALANRLGFPVELVLRQLCCLPPDWSMMEMVVQARLILPLHAYSGNAAPVFSRHAKTGTDEYYDGFVPNHTETITQLFIPGMSSEEVQRRALALEGYGHVNTDRSKSGLVLRSGPGR